MIIEPLPAVAAGDPHTLYPGCTALPIGHGVFVFCPQESDNSAVVLHESATGQRYRLIFETLAEAVAEMDNVIDISRWLQRARVA